MCTAVSFINGGHYFGRNLDLEYSYDEKIVIAPRRYTFGFGNNTGIGSQRAIIGAAYIQNDYPLYYDGMNEAGLCMAALSFKDYAVYGKERQDRDNIPSFDVIAWVLSQCENIRDAKKLLSSVNITDRKFSPELPPSPLHWMVSDREGSAVLESTAQGVKVYDNSIGVLTNSPPFDFQMMNLNNYMGASRKPIENRFSEKADMNIYSNGMGAMGLPGDFSSMSRFVKAAFVKLNSRCSTAEEDNVNQFFHILDSVANPRGSVELGDGKYEITVYSSCCSADKGIYYYTACNNRCITAVDMHRENLEGDTLIYYPLLKAQPPYYQN